MTTVVHQGNPRNAAIIHQIGVIATAALRPVLATLALGLAGATLAGAAESRDYAYLFFQGRITDMVGTRALAGATIRLESGSRVFETRTDPKGGFVFERLPLATYDVAIASPDGQVLEIVRQAGSDDPVRTRFQVKPGQGDGRRARLRVEGDRVVIDVPRPPADWPRFWKQFGIFVGCAGLLAI